jgi:hypothetical protein
VFDPPAGYLDLIGDAETAPYSERFEPLVVPEVGVLTARRPMPSGLADLAMAANPEVADVDRSDYLVRFVSRHLHGDELERVYVAMMAGEAPADSIERIARAIATWGTARPYLAVVTLAVMLGHHYRTVRTSLTKSGIADVMQLPTMHILLDTIEAAVLEAMSGDRDSETKRRVFIDRLYSPLSDPGAPAGPPRGFTDEDTEDAFDAFAAAAR